MAIERSAWKRNRLTKKSGTGVEPGPELFAEPGKPVG